MVSPGKRWELILTYRMKPEYMEACRPFFTREPREWNEMGVQADNLKDEYFITTGSGKFMRNVTLDPAANIGIVGINDRGDAWRIIWKLGNGARPASEFLSHFLNYSVREKATDGANRVIYLCHATNVIALTFILPLTDKAFTSVLLRAATECPVVFPEGVGVVKWMVPGGLEIAIKVYSSGRPVLQTITDEDLRAIARDFHVTLNEDLPG